MTRKAVLSDDTRELARMPVRCGREMTLTRREINVPSHRRWVDRLVDDRTGPSGAFDFILEWPPIQFEIGSIHDCVLRHDRRRRGTVLDDAARVWLLKRVTTGGPIRALSSRGSGHQANRAAEEDSYCEAGLTRGCRSVWGRHLRRRVPTLAQACYLASASARALASSFCASLSSPRSRLIRAWNIRLV